MAMVTAQRERPRHKSVLLYSGGMDSLMMAHMLKPDVCLHVPHGSQYEAEEMRRMAQLTEAGYCPVITCYTGLNLGAFERDDLIIPNRNAYLVLLASTHGEQIYLGAVSGDRSFDKDWKFCQLMTSLLDHMWQDQHWTEARKFAVTIPFKNKTKTDLVRQYLLTGGSKEALLMSYSCYTGRPTPCGQCKPCFRKWVALENNGIDMDGYFEKDPRKSPWLPDLLPAVRRCEYRGAEDIDWQTALATNSSKIIY